MASKRRYPERNCKNCGKSFTPKDSREEYCKKQCSIDFNNDKKKFVNKPFDEFQKAVKINDKVLMIAKRQLSIIGNQRISMDILVVAGYDPDVYFENSIDPKSGTMIFWNINYGLLPLETDKPIFKILKR